MVGFLDRAVALGATNPPRRPNRLEARWWIQARPAPPHERTSHEGLAHRIHGIHRHRRHALAGPGGSRRGGSPPPLRGRLAHRSPDPDRRPQRPVLAARRRDRRHRRHRPHRRAARRLDRRRPAPSGPSSTDSGPTARSSTSAAPGSWARPLPTRPTAESSPSRPISIVDGREEVETAVLESGRRGIVVRAGIAHGLAGGIPGLLVEWARQAGHGRYVRDVRGPDVGHRPRRGPRRPDLPGPRPSPLRNPSPRRLGAGRAGRRHRASSRPRSGRHGSGRALARTRGPRHISAPTSPTRSP